MLRFYVLATQHNPFTSLMIHLNMKQNVEQNKQLSKRYNAFNVYCRELAPGTVSLTGYRAQGDDDKHCAYCIKLFATSDKVN